MKLKTALVILAQFIEKNTYENNIGERETRWVEDAPLCEASGVDPDQLKEALTVAGRSAARALLG